MKKVIEATINNFLQIKSVRVVQRAVGKDVMEKKLFIEALILLREIEDRKDFLEEELGVDLSVYEEKFLQVIENLFKIHYNKEQLALIQFYVYQIPALDNFEGKVDLSDGKETITVAFETPEDVYNVVDSLKKLDKKFGRKN
jgi:hypothetical protein